MTSRGGTATTVIGRSASQGKAATSSRAAVYCTKSLPTVRRSRKSTSNLSCAVLTSRYSPCRVAVTSDGIPRVSPNVADAADSDDNCAPLKQHKHKLQCKHDTIKQEVKVI